MKRIDFEHGTITSNILGAALPMLVAQILSLLYNIVDRIYIARIPGVGTTALGAVGLCFPIIVIITAFSNLFGGGGAPLFSISRGTKDTDSCSENYEYFLYHALYLCDSDYGSRSAFCQSDPYSVRSFQGSIGLCHIHIS